MAKAWSTVAELVQRVRPLEDVLNTFFDLARSRSPSLNSPFNNCDPAPSGHDLGWKFGRPGSQAAVERGEKQRLALQY
jgi:hypothetical protein